MRRLPALSAMKVFEVVGQTRSFTRAAELLNLTQSAVSRQVRNLEEQLGETLVIRRHHHLELTASGAELLASLDAFPHGHAHGGGAYALSANGARPPDARSAASIRPSTAAASERFAAW